ncbi:hypothetical protein AVEN_67129-1 [Araneus ventricosus]|uniref:Uncharacterized protein n=1 Tax=Araneus ventricosus TaxID=182803 RepID=A0A4Y2S2Q6_ARAVE|nr:hypothetical protein AVEN_67129-1 [Araneus ventricosus]
MTRTTFELAPPPPSFHTTPARRRLTNVGTRWIQFLSGIGFRTLELSGSEDRGGQVVRSRLWGQRVPGSKPYATEDPPLHAKSYVVVKCPPLGVAWKFGEGYQFRWRPCHLTVQK